MNLVTFGITKFYMAETYDTRFRGFTHGDDVKSKDAPKKTGRGAGIALALLTATAAVTGGAWFMNRDSRAETAAAVTPDSGGETAPHRRSIRESLPSDYLADGVPVTGVAQRELMARHKIWGTFLSHLGPDGVALEDAMNRNPNSYQVIDVSYREITVAPLDHSHGEPNRGYTFRRPAGLE